MSSSQVERFFIDVQGAQVYVKRWIPANNSDLPPLVLLHDSLGSADLWRDFPRQLAEKLSRTVIAYDRLGFGKSGARSRLPSAQFVEEEAVIYFPIIKEQLALESYVLLGHSVGGGMAINIAAQDAECTAVITVAAQAFVEDLTVEGIRQAKEAFASSEQIGRLEKWHGSKAQWVLNAWTEVWLSEAFKRWSLAPIIRSVTCPVLTIHGDKDEYGSLAFPEFIVENTRGPANMLIMKNGGHVPHRENPQEVVDAIKDFLDSEQQA